MPAPLGLATSISSTRSLISRPGMPAFIAIQPPIVPGMPAPNSRPARPRSPQKRVSWRARRPPRRAARGRGRSSSRRQRESWITTPATGASSTSVLKPPPITWCGTRARAQAPQRGAQLRAVRGRRQRVDRPADAQRREPRERHVEAHRRAELHRKLRAQLAPDHGARSASCATRRAPRLAMLPAPSVSTRSPARTSRSRRSSAASRSGTKYTAR